MANENQTEHVEAVAVTANALEQMERANIDIQIATARKYPRSMDVFYKRAIAMVTFDAETARSCLYRRPVGTNQKTGQQEYAEGESIRLAEIVASSYGHLRICGMIIEMEPRYVKAIGITHDLESNVAIKKEVVESTVNKYGQPFSERMRVVVAKSAQAKAIRDSIFSVIPKSLCKPLVNKAKEVAKGDIKTFETKQKAVVEWIKKLGIEPKRVWNAVGIKGEADISVEVLHLLYGLKTAIDEKDITVDEAFPIPDAEASQGSVYDRIKNKDDHVPDTSKKVDEKKEPDKTKRTFEFICPECSRTYRYGAKEGKGVACECGKAKIVRKPKAKTEAEEPKLVKCPKCDHDVDPAIPHDCEKLRLAKENPPPPEILEENDPPTEDTPTTVGKDTHKCLRCERQFPKPKNDQCPFCMGNITELT